jgi:hypothetical protein
MKTVQKRILWVLLVGLLIGTLWVESRRGNQYKIGMSVAEVRLQCGGKYPLKKLAIGFDHPPTEEERRKEVLYYVCDDQSGIMLYFNDYQILVKKVKFKYFGVNIPGVIDSLRGY